MEKILLVYCDNEECFYDITKPLHCVKCGKLFIECFHCGKINKVKHSAWCRIDCECGVMTIPCSSIYQLRRSCDGKEKRVYPSELR